MLRTYYWCSRCSSTKVLTNVLIKRVLQGRPVAV